MDRARSGLKSIFDSAANSDERLKLIKEKLGAFLDKMSEINPGISGEIESACLIDDADKFTEAMMPVIEQFVRFRIEQPEEYERMAREIFVRVSNFTPLNQLLSYGRHENTLHIHIAPNENVGIKDKLHFLREGLNKLAQVVEADQEITEVTGTSWIIAKHPKLLESLGFTVLGEIDDEKRQKHFSGETRPVAEAYISREDLLEKYL